MLKFSLWRKMTVILLALVVSACGGAGSSAPPPTGGITVTPGNGQVFITWTADPGVDYWLMYAQTSSPIDISNPPINHFWAPSTQLTSPYVLTGLTNALPYSFAMNGRTGGGIGGAQSPSAFATPRPAGANWIGSSGTTASGDLHGIAFGTSSADAQNYYLAVGDGGVMYKSLDSVIQSLTGYIWSPIAAPVTTPLPAVNYKAATNMFSRYIAVGDGGVGGGANNIVSSTDLVTWTPAAWASGTSAPSKSINALAGYGTALVAVGNQGSVYYTTDGLTWTASNPVPNSPDLYGVTYSAYTGLWIAVGASGALLTSPDGITWTAGNSGVSVNLYSVTATIATATLANVVVAVGDNGTIITNSTMTATPGGAGAWVAPTVGPTDHRTLYAINTDSVQFLVVGQGGGGQSGTAYTSLDGLTWSPANTTQTNSTPAVLSPTLYNIIGSASKYLVVGQSGAIISSIN